MTAEEITPMQELCNSLIYQMNSLDRDNPKLRHEHYILSGVYDFAKTLIEKEQQYASIKARESAEKAWEEAFKSQKNNTYYSGGGFYDVDYDGIDKEKETYLNTHHPIK